MSDRLEVLKAELEQLEAQGRYDAPQYGWLAETVERLELFEEAAKPPPAPEPEQASGTDLAARMAAMVANPGRFSDAEQRAAIEELNAQVRATTRAMLGEGDDEPESEDVTALAAEMRLATQTMDRGDLDPVQATELAARFNTAVHYQTTHVTPVEELRALLADNDVQARFQAAAELSRRGLLEDGVGEQMLGWLNAQVREAAEAGPLGGAEVPEHLRDLATRLRDQVAADEAELRGRLDPRDQLTSEVNALVRQASEQARERDLAAVPAGAPSTEPTEGSPTQEA